MWARTPFVKSILGPCPHSLRSSTLRLFSSSTTKENFNTKPESNDIQPENVVSQQQHVEDTAPYTEFVEPTPIQSLNIQKKIETMEKPGSIFNKYYLGSFDKDLLSFPFLLKTRQEFLQMNQQYEMVRSTWNKITKNDETLDLLGFNSLYKLSISEMMFIFEAIGGSIQKQFAFGTKEDKEIRYEKKMAKSFNIAKPSNRHNIPEMAFQCFHDTRQTLETLVPLILRNSLVYYAISKSSNVDMKETFLNTANPAKIGLALSEPFLDQSSDHLSWKSEAKLTNDYQSWVVSAQKCKIIKGDYSHYLLFCRTKTIGDRLPTLSSDSYSEGVVALLVPSDKVEVSEDGSDYFGIEYQTIRLRDVKLQRASSEVTRAQKDISDFANIKGCGQLATSAVILGMMKQLLKNTYAHLVNEKLGLAHSELMQYKLYQVTSKIYSLESMLYMTAAMFDSFERGVNLEGESIAVKSMATSVGYSICHEMRSIFGSRFPFASTALDLIYSLDSLLDSSVHNRVLLGQRALLHYKSNSGPQKSKLDLFAKAPIYSVKNYLKYRKLQRGSEFLTKEMTKYAHHNLHSACEWIESCINRLEYSSHLLINQNDENTMTKHKDLDQLASIGMDIFMMISVLSRANHAICYGIRNGDAEKELCLAICKETFLKHLQIFEDLSKETMSDNDEFARNIFSRNIKEGGYFASLFRL